MTGVDLYWIPLGAGSPVVRTSGLIFEAIAARCQHRPCADLYHGALQLLLPDGRFTVEQAPVPDRNGAARGVIAVGPVGVRGAGRWRVLRYEVRCWRDGTIPDLRDAVDSPVHLSGDADVASRIIDVLPSIPTPVWGRDEAGVGEMWNSNSVIAWALTRAGIDASALHPPAGGRTPGWGAGCAVAVSEQRYAETSDEPGMTLSRGHRHRTRRTIERHQQAFAQRREDRNATTNDHGPVGRKESPDE